MGKYTSSSSFLFIRLLRRPGAFIPLVSLLHRSSQAASGKTYPCKTLSPLLRNIKLKERDQNEPYYAVHSGLIPSPPHLKPFSTPAKQSSHHSRRQSHTQAQPGSPPL